jgi:hypothetical protein
MQAVSEKTKIPPLFGLKGRFGTYPSIGTIFEFMSISASPNSKSCSSAN